MKREGWSTVVCCASGRSFSEAQAALIIEARRRDACRVVVISDNYLRVPNADAIYSADGSWWKEHLDRVRHCSGELWTQDHAASVKYGLRWVEFVIGDKPLAADDARISGGRNSGLQAMMLARQFGARKIILVGYDMDGPQKWFGLHNGLLANGDSTTFIKHFENIAPALCAEGTEVINCSPGSRLECFPRADIAATLELHANA
jgi:hypothetical protein